MRFVPFNCLKPGQVLGHDLVFDKNRVLLRNGVELTASLIRKIGLLGYQGVYIEDDISKNLYIEDVISDELRLSAQREIRSLFLAAEATINYKSLSQIGPINSVISNLVDEILHNRHAMVNVIDLRAYDDYTYSHSINVAVLSTVLGMVLGLNRRELNELALGALVHDIGKVFIDKRIINKTSKLNFEEFEEMKRHSLAGYNYLISNSAIPDASKAAVLSHHEQYSGAGYPTGLLDNEIPLFGRIVSVADVYDALTSNRPYRHALLPSDAIEYVMSGYNSMFDPMVVDAIVRKVAPYPIGTCVRLSSGAVAIVTENYENACLRPKVKLVDNGVLTSQEIDLARDYNALNITIQEIVNL